MGSGDTSIDKKKSGEDEHTKNEKHYTLPNPNEQAEQSRLDLQHQAWLTSFDGALKAPNLPCSFQPRSVLDIGCGSGTWALAYALQNPDSTVTAIDVNPPTISRSPPNLSVLPQSIDAQQQDQWPHGKTFDYIHLRMLLLAIKDWPSLFRICWNHLNPGGWIELNDTSFPFQAENGAATPETSLFLQFGQLFLEAHTRRGLDVTASSHFIGTLTNQGFTQALQTTIKWPMNGEWPVDEKHKRIGAITNENFQSFSQHGPKMLSTLGMGHDEASEFIMGMLKELKEDRDVGYYLAQYITIAQKPFMIE